MSTLTKEQEQLVVSNTKLVHYIANRYYQESMDREDLAQVGMIGLIKAGKIFDASKGYKFSTLAGKCINGEIIKSFRKKRIKALSLNQPLTNDEMHAEHIDLIADGIKQQTDVLIKIDLQNALLKLSELERFVIKHSFGLETGHCLTQSQIAKMINFSQMYISRVKRDALEKLRKELEGVY